MEQQLFRIRLDLSSFFQDHRRQAYCIVKSEWKNVKCLRKHIENLFKLQKIALTINDIFIPGKECLDIIKQNDVIKVILCQQNSCQVVSGSDIESKKWNEQNRSVKTNGCLETNLEFLGNKKPGPIMTEKKRKIIEDDFSLVGKKEKLIENLDKLEQSLKLLTSNGQQSHVEADSKHLVKNGKKRVRKRKRKQNLKAFTQEEVEPAPILTENPFRNKRNPNVKSSTQYSEQKGHIHFDDEGSILMAQKLNSHPVSPEKTERCIKFENFLDTQRYDKPRLIKGICIPNKAPAANSEKMILTLKDQQNEGHYETLIGPTIPNGLSNGIVVAEDIKTMQFESAKGSTFEVSDQSVEPLNTAEILEHAVQLDGYPEVGDILVFKIFKLNGLFESGLSSYICGNIEEFNELTNFVKIFILDGKNEIEILREKFSIDGNNIQEEKSDYFEGDLNDMFEKKIFKIKS